MLDLTSSMHGTGERIVAPPLPVELKGLSYATGGKRVIESVDLKITTSLITAIMGPNGAGKSVLLRLMHGLITPTEGEIRWAGWRMDRSIVRRQAMVFQRPVLLRRSVAANISHALGLRGVKRSERAIRVDKALRLAGLEDHASRPARVLSGGEQQRLCLARALSLKPAVLFLDEPTSSLDPVSTLAIERLLLDAMQGDASLFTRADEIELAWHFIDQLTQEPGLQPHNYAVGSMGPAAADELLAKQGSEWH